MYCLLLFKQARLEEGFFFFQAEDGIRDKLVTGVQTLLFRSWRRRPATPATPTSRTISKRSRRACARAKPRNRLAKSSARCLRARTTPPDELLTIHPEQARRVATEDRYLLVIGQSRRGEDVVHRMRLPRDRMVAAKHDLARANLRHEVAERLGGEHKGIEIELVEVFARLLLQFDLGIAVLRRDETGVV